MTMDCVCSCVSLSTGTFPADDFVVHLNGYKNGHVRVEEGKREKHTTHRETQTEYPCQILQAGPSEFSSSRVKGVAFIG
jgi:hypothetical protein